ncbi:hypothetical protein BT96DRAFT_999108 [Gymnopus androsaceus JB14]|uniref:Uncharacterized protein n=1 Tax=Gymnopus androsaceus JB14 TaxID=1447944 RepID=A0A6A4H932_9AGAR|nr:hypothetical protein BT96DRAFT_999108 [Gymnopus androsaceus JB14]
MLDLCFSPSKHLFDPSEDILIDNMFIDFKAEDKNLPDNAQEEEDTDDDLGIEEESSPHVDNEVEFLSKAVE